MFRFNMAPDYANMTPEEVIARRKRLAVAMASRRTAPTAVEGLAQIAVALINNGKDKKLAGREAELREQAVADAEAWLGGMGGAGTGYGGGYATTYSDKSPAPAAEPEETGPKLSFGSKFEAANVNTPDRKALYPVGVDASKVTPTTDYPLGVDPSTLNPMGWAAGLTGVPGSSKPAPGFGGGKTAGGGATGSYALPAEPVVEGFKAAHLAKGAPAVPAPTPSLVEPPVEGFRAAFLANGGLKVPAPVESGTAISKETSDALSGFYQDAIKKPDAAGRERIAEALRGRGGRGRGRDAAGVGLAREPVASNDSVVASAASPALSFGLQPEPQAEEAPALPQGVRAGTVPAQVYEGLIKRGMAPHVAEGFLMNFQDESGFNLDIVEGAPNVYGTRGKGLYQLTNDRRDAFERRYGNDYSLDNQLDFLMYELNGPESKAGSIIMSTKDAGQAGAAVVSEFLRPAKEHENARIAKYTGGEGMDYRTSGGSGYSGGGSTGTGTGTGAGGRSVAGLAALLANPMLPDSYKEILASIYDADMKAASPKERDSVVVGDMLVDRATGQVIADYSGSGSGTSGADKPMTESQTKLYLFSNIQSQVTPLINSLEDAGFNPSNAPDFWGNGVLDTSYFVSPEGQKYNSAAASWAAAALRVETGAAATPQEIKAMQERYFAVPGDNQETIATKRKLREGYENVLKTALGGDKNAAVAPIDFGTPAPGGNRTGNGKTVVQYDSNGNRVK